MRTVDDDEICRAHCLEKLALYVTPEFIPPPDARPTQSFRTRGMRAILLVVLATTSAAALEAKWTPASDGGPARFSKKYRDAQGIDDSRWTKTDDEAGFSIFPTTSAGWAIAAIAFVVIFVMLGQRPPQQWQAGQAVGGASSGARVRSDRRRGAQRSARWGL